MVTVAVDVGQGEDVGETVKELRGRESEGGAAGGIRLGQNVEDLIGAAADEVETLEGEGRPGTIPDQTFEAGAVGGLDADGGIEAKAAPVVPGEHVGGLVGLQKAMATEMSEYPGSDDALQAFQELRRESGDLVEAEAGCLGFGALVRIDPLEKPVEHAKVKVEMRVQRRAEPMKEAHRPERRGGRGRGAGLPQDGLESPEEDMEDSAGGPGPVVEERAEALGDREDPLAGRHVGEDMVHQVGGGFGHALGVAGGAGPSPLAGKSHQKVVAAA